MALKSKLVCVLGIILMVKIVYIGLDRQLIASNIFSALPEPRTVTREVTSVADTSRKKKLDLEAYLVKRAVRVREVNCLKVLEGDPREVQKAKVLESHKKRVANSREVLLQATHCSSFLRHHGFLMEPLTGLETEFPLAFSVLVFKDASQVVGLLRAIYRPQNLYCLHVDRTSDRTFRAAMEAVSGCLPNVFLASRSIDVRWGTYTVLEPEIVCMGDLWRRGKTWKYFINLTGQEFPLRTNYELVRILSAYKGANNVQGGVASFPTVKRWLSFLPAPHNISVYKGPVHIVVSRAFVGFVLHDPRAQDFLRWCQQTHVPDEHFFNSLHFNLHLRVPGSYADNGTEVKQVAMPHLNRYKIWTHRKRTRHCPGKKIVRGICILNVLDLPALYNSRRMFANKFHAGYSRLALRCLAETLHNRTRDQTLGKLDYNVTFHVDYPQ